MKTLLLINTSPDLLHSASRQLTQAFVTQWQERNPQGQVIVRDIGQEPVPHLLQDALGPIVAPQQEAVTGLATHMLCKQLITEIKAADFIVFGVPMFNLSIPSTLKAYFDHIAIAGETWGGVDYGKDKRVVVITTGGSLLQDTGYDFQAPYIKVFLKTIDLDDVTFIKAHGLCKSAELRKEAIANAEQAITKFITKQFPTLPAPLTEDGKHIEKGLSNYAFGHYEEAIAEFTHAIMLNTNCAKHYLHRGNTNFALQRYEAAISDYSMAVAIDPKQPIFYSNRAEAKRKQNDMAGSTEDLKKAIMLDNKGQQQVDYPYYRIAREITKKKLTTASPTIYAEMANKAYKGFVKKLEEAPKKANGDLPCTLYYLGRCYDTGCGIEMDQHKAKQYYQKASRYPLPANLNAKVKQRLKDIALKSSESKIEDNTKNICADLLQVKLAN